MTENTQDMNAVVADGIAQAEVLIENGEYNQAWWFLDSIRDEYIDTIEQDPNYGTLLELVSLALFKDDTLAQADVVMQKLEIHIGTEHVSDRAKQLRQDIERGLEQVQENTFYLNPLEN